MADLPIDVRKWTNFSMLDAGKLGVTSNNSDAALASKKPHVRLVSTDCDFGEQIGLTRDWVVRIVRAVGNYGESFDRNIGTKARLGIPRGLNQLGSGGGIQYGPPIR